MAMMYRDRYHNQSYPCDEFGFPVRRSRGHSGLHGMPDPLTSPYHDPYCQDCGDAGCGRRPYMLPYDHWAPPRPRGVGGRPMMARAQTDFGPRHYAGGLSYEDMLDETLVRPRRRGVPRGYGYGRERYHENVW